MAKMLIISRFISTVKKNLECFLNRIDQLIQIHKEIHKNLKQPKIYLKKNKAGGLLPHDFNIDHKTTVLKTCSIGVNIEKVCNYNKTEGPEVDLYLYGQLIFERVQRQFDKKRQSFQ